MIGLAVALAMDVVGAEEEAVKLVLWGFYGFIGFLFILMVIS